MNYVLLKQYILVYKQDALYYFLQNVFQFVKLTSSCYHPRYFLWRNLLSQPFL